MADLVPDRALVIGRLQLQIAEQERNAARNALRGAELEDELIPHFVAQIEEATRRRAEADAEVADGKLDGLRLALRRKELEVEVRRLTLQLQELRHERQRIDQNNTAAAAEVRKLQASIDQLEKEPTNG